MLHELLFALNGYSGHVFLLLDGKFKVNEALPFFHPAEIGILNQLLDIATDFWKIETFVRENRDCTVNRASSKEEGLYGMYTEALCEGLSQVVQPYRKALVELEKTVLKAGETQLSFIQHKIYPYQAVMRGLCGLIHQIKYKKAHGCYILDIVYRASCSGVAEVREAMQRILFEGHKVLYKQLLSWILQGSLCDPYEEFFVAKIRQESVAKEKSPSVEIAPEDSLKESLNHYKLRVEMIPCHISVLTAEKIFFIGESIQLFEKDRGDLVDSFDESGGAPPVLKEQETEFYNRLAELSESSEFRVADFERFVDAVRETASRHLHSLVLESADLRKELGTLRSLFLLARGELFQMFIEEADSYLQIPPTAATQHDISQAFMSACHRLLPDDEATLKKVKLQIVTDAPLPVRPPGKLSNSSQPRLTGWQCLSLAYTVPWPLHLIITKGVLEQYNQIFRFLLNVKRTQLLLHDAWAEQKRDRCLIISDSWQLRNHMMFVVDNLQHYLMADVLESQYALLLNRIEQSDNFEELKHAHELFLASIVAHTFISNKPVHQCLTDLLVCCQQYCRLVNVGEIESKKLTDLSLNFSRQSSLLFKLLSSIRSRQTGTQLAQLLLRIDYNRYFSKFGHDIGRIGV